MNKSMELMEQYADIGLVSQSMKEFLDTYRSGIHFILFIVVAAMCTLYAPIFKAIGL